MTCRTAAELVCRSFEEPLAGLDRVGVGLHTVLCGACRRFRRQLVQVDAALAAGPVPLRLPGPGLPPEARERIAAAVRRP